MQQWIKRILTAGCLILAGSATADSPRAYNHLVEANMLYATLDAGGNDNFHTGKMLAVNYNYFFKSWLAVTAGILVTEEIREKPQEDLAGQFRGIIQTNAITLGLRPKYAFSERNGVYARAGVLVYQTELQVEQFFGAGLPNGTTADKTSGFGYLLAAGWAHSFTPRFSMQFELNYMAQPNMFDESPNAFDLTSTSFGLGIAYAF